jgi:hypothetical protein
LQQTCCATLQQTCCATLQQRDVLRGSRVSESAPRHGRFQIARREELIVVPQREPKLNAGAAPASTACRRGTHAHSAPPAHHAREGTRASLQHSTREAHGGIGRSLESACLHARVVQLGAHL